MHVLEPMKNHSAFLPRTPGEGLYGHFRTGAHNPPAYTSHLRAPQAVLGTEGRREERGEGRRGDHATEEEEDSGEKRGEESDWSSAGDGSGISSASSNGYDKSSM